MLDALGALLGLVDPESECDGEWADDDVALVLATAGAGDVEDEPEPQPARATRAIRAPTASPTWVTVREEVVSCEGPVVGMDPGCRAVRQQPANGR